MAGQLKGLRNDGLCMRHGAKASRNGRGRILFKVAGVVKHDGNRGMYHGKEIDGELGVQLVLLHGSVLPVHKQIQEFLVVQAN